MRHSTHHFAARSGFTLVELIIALAMAAILAASIAKTLDIAFHAVNAADAVLAPSRTADLAMEQIANDFQSCATPNTTITNANNIYDLNTLGASSGTTSSTTGGGGGGGTGGGAASSSASSNAAPTGWVLSGSFEGTQAQADGMEADDVSFFTTSDSPDHPDGNGEMKWVEITVDVPKGSSDHCLVRKVTPNLTTEATPVRDEEVLCRGVTGLTLSYFDGTNWNDTWDSTAEDNTIPVAVQLVFSIQKPMANGQMQKLNFTRVFTLSTSTAAQDTNVNTGAGI